MEGRLYLRLLIRNRVPIALLIALSVLAGAVLYAVAPATYRSSMTFTVQSEAGSREPSEIYQAELLSQARAQTYQKLVSGRALAARVRARMDGPVSVDRLVGDISASVAQGAVLLHITVTDHSAAVVDSASKTLVTEFPAYVSQLQAPGDRNVTTAQLAAAPAPADKIAPSKVRYLGLGLLAGLLLAVLFSVAREAANRRLRDADDIRSVTGPGPVVVALPRRPVRRRRKVDPAVVLSGVVARAAAERRPLAFVPLPASRATAHGMLDLARRLTAGGQRVGLVDTDVDGGYLSGIVKADERVQIVDLAALASGAVAAEASIAVLPVEALLELAVDQATATSPGRPDSGMVSAAVDKAVAVVGERVDVVVLAAGSILLRARPSFLASESPESIVLVRRRQSTKAELATALDVLRQFGCAVGAIVLLADAPRRRRR